MSVRVRRCRLCVGTCLTKSGLCRDAFGQGGLMSGLVRLGRLIFGTGSVWSGYCRDFSARSG